MRVLDTFSGIGGLSLGLEWAGMETVAFCEVDEKCRQILDQRWPGVPCYTDIKTLTGDQLERDGIRDIGLICGGYPCQPFSLAGKRDGEEDDRHLWPELFRLIQEVRPPWVLCENVTGHITMGLDSVLADLEGAGYACQSFVIPACAVGALHRRDRVFIIANADSDPLWPEQERQRGGSRETQSGDHGEERPVAYADRERESQQDWVELSIEKRLVDRGEDVPDTDSQGLPQREMHPGSGGGTERTQSGEEPAMGASARPVSDAQRGQRSLGGNDERVGWQHQFDQEERSRPGEWAPEPSVGRLAHGVPGRVDRIKQLGNAVVPQVAEMIGRAILHAEEMIRRAILHAETTHHAG